MSFALIYINSDTSEGILQNCSNVTLLQLTLSMDTPELEELHATFKAF